MFPLYHAFFSLKKFCNDNSYKLNVSVQKEKMSKLNKIILIGVSALLVASAILNITQCSRNKNKKQETKNAIVMDSIQVGTYGDTVFWYNGKQYRQVINRETIKSYMP